MCRTRVGGGAPYVRVYVRADLAQLVEQLSCKQQVIGSSPIVGSTKELTPNRTFIVLLLGIGNPSLFLGGSIVYERHGLVKRKGSFNLKACFHQIASRVLVTGTSFKSAFHLDETD